MVDEETQDVAPGRPGGAPVNRDARRDPEVIEGEIAPRTTHEKAPSGDPPSAGPSADAPQNQSPPPSRSAAPPASPKRAGARGFFAGALGGLIVSALAAGAGAYYLAPKADLAEEEAGRLAKLEAETARDSAAMADLGKRVGVLEASAAASGGLDKRIAALQAASADEAQKLQSVTDSAQRLAKQLTDVHADLDAARGQISPLAERIAQLEAGATRTGGGPDAAALAARLDKVEAALAAPKSETRVAAEKPAAADNPAAVAIVAAAIRDKLASGAPFAPELSALERLGVDPAALAPLKAVVDGAPTGAELAASFEAVAPKVLAASQPVEESGGPLDRLVAHMRGLVQVRNLSETMGRDPQALVSQIEAASRRGEAAEALTALDKLTQAAREAAGGWPAQARELAGADLAVQSIRQAAITRLSGAKP